MSLNRFIHLCFTISSPVIALGTDESFERLYETVYKPAIKFLYSNPDISITFAFNGCFLQYLEKKHTEFLTIIGQMVSRKQIEILGGGFYNPVFPLLLPMDRTGQIELLSNKIRKTTKKRPRGIAICGKIWDSSLITSFSTCGMEYVLLDESAIPEKKLNFIPLIMNEKGKSIGIIPVCNSFKSKFINGSIIDLFLKRIKKILKTNSFISANTPLGLCIQLTPEELKLAIEKKSFEKLKNEIPPKKEKFIFSTPYKYYKESHVKVPAHISTGIAKDIAQWAEIPYKAVKPNPKVTIYDFFQIYPQSKALYDRMMYISLLVSQFHSDRMRKIAAREKLWEAQNGDGFICTSKGAFTGSTYRQHAYKNLTEAEKILREGGNFKESLATFDYNGDGLDEYVCRMADYTAVITPVGGCINELDVMQASGNYADNFSCIKEFEGENDNYQRSLFVDHFFSDKEFENYLENKPAGNGIFSKILYSQIGFSQQHKEILLETTALIKKNKITLKKRIVATSSAIMIQYIMRNDGENSIKGKFAVESSFAQTNFNSKDFNAFKLEIIANSQKEEIDTKSSSKDLNESGKLSNVEGFQLTDTDNSICFFFEPNESCGLIFKPIIFKRPEYTTGELVPASMTFANALFWEINLTPGMEIEKTINFSIFAEHKNRKNRK